MPALPTVGGSSGSWGTELNAFLGVGHDADGTHTTSDLIASLAAYIPTYDGTQILNNATPPVDRTVIDLKAFTKFNTDIGNNMAFVTLLITAYATTDISFARGTDTADIGLLQGTQYGGGFTACTIGANRSAFVLVPTDSQGRISWKRGSSFGNVNVWILSYQRIRI